MNGNLTEAMKDYRVLDAIVMQSPIGISLTDRSGAFLAVNPTMVGILGYSEDDLKNMTFQQVTLMSDVIFEMELYNAILRGNRDEYDIIKRYIKKNGEVVWSNVRVSVVRGKDGTVDCLIKHVVPILSHRDTVHASINKRAITLSWLITASVLSITMSVVAGIFFFFNRSHIF